MGIDEPTELKELELNTIEQAARRLAQLRSAGVDAPSETTKPAIPTPEIDGETVSVRRLPSMNLPHEWVEAMTVRFDAFSR